MSLVEDEFGEDIVLSAQEHLLVGLSGSGERSCGANSLARAFDALLAGKLVGGFVGKREEDLTNVPRGYTSI